MLASYCDVHPVLWLHQPSRRSTDARSAPATSRPTKPWSTFGQTFCTCRRAQKTNRRIKSEQQGHVLMFMPEHTKDSGGEVPNLQGVLSTHLTHIRPLQPLLLLLPLLLPSAIAGPDAKCVYLVVLCKISHRSGSARCDNLVRST